MSRARLEEAARAVVRYLNGDDATATIRPNIGVFAVEAGSQLHRDLAAALAAPEDGDVVERDTLIRVADVLRENCFNLGDVEMRQARALSAAGLLARPVDRERIERVCAGALDGMNSDSLWVDAMAHRLTDAILREVGR